MNLEHVRLWLSTVLGGLAGWINLRAIDSDQAHPPVSHHVRTIDEAVSWCQRFEAQRMNLYAGLARRGEQRNERGSIDASEKNLAGCQVLWVDLDDGTHADHAKRLAEFPLKPTLTINSGGGTHALWKLEDPIECASDPESNKQLRNILRGIQVVLGGDPAVTDPARIFRIAGTMNYPHARKRAKGRGDALSSVIESNPYTAALDDFDMFELRGQAEAKQAPREAHGHGEAVPPQVEYMLGKNDRMRRVFYCEERLHSGDPSAEDFSIAAGLWKHAPWLKSEDIAAALRFRRIALAHLVKGSAKTDGYYASTVAKARRKALDGTEAPDFDVSHARWFQWVFAKAMHPRAMPEIRDSTDHDIEPHRISTSIPELDQATGGGVYGFTVVPGDSGVGKSTVALNVAIEARIRGWDVLYVAAEMSTAEYTVRGARYLRMSPDEAKASGLLPLVAEVADGLSLDALIDMVISTPTDKTERFLLVIDSLTKVSAFIDAGDSPHSLFSAMGHVNRLAEQSVRFGERRIAVLMTSELNKDGAALGRRVTFNSSLQVNMMQQNKEQPDLVMVSIPKARFSAKKAPFGPFRQDWRANRLDDLSGGTQVEREERYLL